MKKFNKRFWIFAGSVYYPQGALQDLINTCNSLDDVACIIKTWIASQVNNADKTFWQYHWLNIFDSVTEEYLTDDLILSITKVTA